MSEPADGASWILERWIPALRSGRYRQGKRNLRNPNDTYCCLGVACDLMVTDGILTEWKKDGFHWQIMGQQTVLPTKASQFLGMSMTGLISFVEGVPFSLSILNDEKGWTFDQIADILEEAYKPDVDDPSHREISRNSS